MIPAAMRFLESTEELRSHLVAGREEERVARVQTEIYAAAGDCGEGERFAPHSRQEICSVGDFVAG